MNQKVSKRILVTGATGQIGSELTAELRKRYGGDNVVATGHKRKPSPEMLNAGPFEYIDVTKATDIFQVVDKYGVGAIYHLASILSAEGEKDTSLTWNTNLMGLFNVLEAARIREIRVFWPSSIAVFGPEVPRINTPQETILIPLSMYGVTKVAGELLCNYYFNRYGLDVRCIRFPGIISLDVLPSGGTTDYAAAMLYEAIKNRRYTCFVRRDTVLPMMYMPDCIKAEIMLMEANPSRIKHRTGYNVSAMSFSAGELEEEIRKYIPEFKCEFKPDFRQKIADTWPMLLDDRLAREEWNWKPDYDLSSMVKDIMEKMLYSNQ